MIVLPLATPLLTAHRCAPPTSFTTLGWRARVAVLIVVSIVPVTSAIIRLLPKLLCPCSRHRWGLRSEGRELSKVRRAARVRGRARIIVGRERVGLTRATRLCLRQLVSELGQVLC